MMHGFFFSPASPPNDSLNWKARKIQRLEDQKETRGQKGKIRLKRKRDHLEKGHRAAKQPETVANQAVGGGKTSRWGTKQE